MYAAFFQASPDAPIEDPTNLWLFDPVARVLLPVALRWGIPANAITLAGLLPGAAAAEAYASWFRLSLAFVGLLLTFAWLVFDSLDGMVARATKTTSAFGRELDGICDHAVFVLIYVALARSIGTREGWVLAIAAGAVHVVQANFYEVERERFHRRLLGRARATDRGGSRNPLARVYDRVAAGFEAMSARFERRSGARDVLGPAYAAAAVTPLRLLLPLSQNMRMIAICVACLCGDPRLFWWYEIGPLSVLAIMGALWLRRIEARLAPI